MAYFGISSAAVLCHSYCHTGTELSNHALKLSECVRKRSCEVSQALDWAKRTAGSRDMRFCAKTLPIQYPLKKGLMTNETHVHVSQRSNASVLCLFLAFWDNNCNYFGMNGEDATGESSREPGVIMERGNAS